MKIRPHRDRAIMILQKEISVFVYDAIQLEGYNFTLPEIQTLLEGITVGGHKISDQQIAVNQGNAWKQLIEWIKYDNFHLTKGVVCDLHKIAAKEEALDWGKFRSSSVTIAGTEYMPPQAKDLDLLFAGMIDSTNSIPGLWERAITVFLEMARNQFFYDVNKRMGRFVMNGILVSNGYPPINLPATKSLEFNTLMLEFYPSGKKDKMIEFMKSCIKPVHLEILSE